MWWLKNNGVSDETPGREEVKFLDAKDGLVESVWGRNHALTLTIDQKIEVFEYRDTDKHLRAEHPSIADDCTSEHFDKNACSCFNFFYPSINILSVSMAETYHTELVRNKRRDGKTRSASINEGLNGVAMHLLRSNMPQPSEYDFTSVA